MFRLKMLSLNSIFVLFVCWPNVIGLSYFWKSATTRTVCGQVRGLYSELDDAFSFRGIPFASPPVGNLRWRPPVPLTPANNNCWSGTLKATSFGNQCFQRENKHYVGEENCLFLNVWTPTLSKFSRLPVMFWIHGGYLLNGNGNEEETGYAPSAKLAADTNMVYVSINYRLHAFGFMALKWLVPGSPTNTSGNYGLMDMIEGLRWVKHNIGNFGGDPNQVTVFGQSSGGTSIFALLASPLCRGLFHKAWLLSSSAILNKTAADAFTENEVFVTNTGCADVECLYNLSPSHVTASVPWDVYPYWAMEDLMDLPEKGLFMGALIIVDGYVLEEAPFKAWMDGNGNDVPVLVGTTAQESDLDPRPHQVVHWKWTDGYYERYVKHKLDSFGEFISQTALTLYPPGVKTPEFQLTSMISDIRVNCGNNYLSLIAAYSFASPVFRYVATYYPKQDNTSFANKYPAHYSFHNIDCLAFFGSFSSHGSSPTVSDLMWESNIRQEVMAFVETGFPESPTWRPYPASTALLAETTRVMRGYHDKECAFWLANGFFSYSWIN